jgi:exosortase
MASELNARIGRTVPSPMYGVLVGDGGRDDEAFESLEAAWRSIRPAAWLLGGLVVALWPHWIYMARRMTDGSDEPWGILALATVLVLLVRDHSEIGLPSRPALVASAALAVCAAVASFVAPDLLAAAIAMLALALFVVHALQARPATPLAALLLLALPVIASLQFYLGYPLRVFTAHASTWLLAAFGIEAAAAGASIVYQGTTVLVDAPCAGIGMLWIGSYTAALLSYLARASAWRTAANAAAAGVLVLAANVTRNTALFFTESGLLPMPAWGHEAVGLVALALALVPIILIASRSSR